MCFYHFQIESLKVAKAKIPDGRWWIKELLNTLYGEQKMKYEKKLSQANVAENILFGLAWDVIGLETLLQQNIKLLNDIRLLISKLDGTNKDNGNIAKQLSELKKDMSSYAKGVFGKQRTAASHIFAFMISEEQRNMKPYATAVRFFPYNSLTDRRLGELKDEIVQEMKKINMVPVGKWANFLLLSATVLQTYQCR